MVDTRYPLPAPSLCAAAPRSPKAVRRDVLRTGYSAPACPYLTPGAGHHRGARTHAPSLLATLLAAHSFFRPRARPRRGIRDAAACTPLSTNGGEAT